MGYQIHTFSSPSLSFYNMDDVLFGKDHALTDTLFIPDASCTELYQRDEAAMDAMIAQMNAPGSGRVFLLFLDSSHFGYSFPKSFERFTPCDEGASFLTALLSKQAPEELVNRYQNALLFLDAQLGKFFNVLESTEQGKQSIVVITGDHGEEFYEKGNLFHATTLSKEQITPPIYYKFGDTARLKSKISCQATSHIDIFPSIFHYLTGCDVTASVFDGQSIFNATRWPYTVIARFNVSNTPIQYCLHGPLLKLIVEFDQSDIFQSKQLQCLSIKTFEDETVSLPFSSLEEAFGPAFARLFPLINPSQ
jgi:membrane-anchored protein YejM (alkaline phosphatase superfamily)